MKFYSTSTRDFFQDMRRKDGAKSQRPVNFFHFRKTPSGIFLRIKTKLFDERQKDRDVGERQQNIEGSFEGHNVRRKSL